MRVMLSVIDYAGPALSATSWVIKASVCSLIHLFVGDCGMWSPLKHLLPRSMKSTLYIIHPNVYITLWEKLLLTFWNIPFQLFFVPWFHVGEYTLHTVLYLTFLIKLPMERDLHWLTIWCRNSCQMVNQPYRTTFFKHGGQCCPVMEAYTMSVGGRITLFS